MIRKYTGNGKMKHMGKRFTYDYIWLGSEIIDDSLYYLYFYDFNERSLYRIEDVLFREAINKKDPKRKIFWIALFVIHSFLYLFFQSLKAINHNTILFFLWLLLDIVIILVIYSYKVNAETQLMEQIKEKAEMLPENSEKLYELFSKTRSIPSGSIILLFMFLFACGYAVHEYYEAGSMLFAYVIPIFCSFLLFLNFDSLSYNVLRLRTIIKKQCLK